MKVSEIVKSINALAEEQVKKHDSLDYKYLLFYHYDDDYYLIIDKDQAFKVIYSCGKLYDMYLDDYWWLGIDYNRVHKATKEEQKFMGKFWHLYLATMVELEEDEEEEDDEY